MNYGLTERNINTLYNIFSDNASLKKVILYGSRAMGNYKNGSDIDITVELEDNYNRSDFLKLCRAFDESNLPYFVDCSIFSTIKNQELINHINRVGKILYEKESN